MGYIRYLNPENHHPAKIQKAGKDVSKNLDFKDIKFQANIKDIRKIEKNNSIGISVFGYESKKCKKKVKYLCIKKML